MGHFEVHSVQLCRRLTVFSQQCPLGGTCLAVPAEGGLWAEEHNTTAVAVAEEAELRVCSKSGAEVAGIVGESAIACIGERL